MKAVKMLCRLLLMAAILTALFLIVTPENFAKDIRGLDWRWFSAALLLMPLFLALRVIKWLLLVRQTNPEVGVKKVFRGYMWGMAVGLATPGRAGELTRIWAAGLPTRCVGLFLLEKMLELQAVAWLCLASLISLGVLPLEWSGIIAMLLVLSSAFWRRWVIFAARASHRLLRRPSTEQLEAFEAATAQVRTGWCAALSIVCPLIFCVQNWLMFHSLGERCDFHIASTFPLVFLANIFPITIGGLGMREAIAMFLLRDAGVSLAVVMTSFLFVSIVDLFVPAAIGAAFYAARSGFGSEVEGGLTATSGSGHMSTGEKRRCLACGDEQARVFEYREHEYDRCVNCGLTSTYPIPDDAAIEAHYAEKFARGNYKLLRQYANSYNVVYRDFADILEKELALHGRKLEGLRLLDVGCFTGEFLLELQRRGADVYGLELQTEAVKLSEEKLPGRVFQADVHSNDFPAMEFDVVTLMGVIEHVVSPRSLTARAAELLKPGGLLLLQTPDSGSLLARIMGKYWPPYAPVEHIHLFSSKSLETLLGQFGFGNYKHRRQWKRLPIGYVYNMLQNFGPEFHKLLHPVYRLLPEYVRNLAAPVYVGGMVVTATSDGQQCNKEKLDERESIGEDIRGLDS